MTDTTPKLKIYPSASGFSTGTSYEVEYSNSCLRYLLVSQGIAANIPEDMQKMGAQHEDWWAAQLGDRLKERELPIKKDYGNNVEYSGRMDFVTVDGEIHETKASMSKNMLYKVIRKQQVKLNHLAQLLSYMLHTEIHKGRIIVGFYKKDEVNNTFLLKEYAEFAVKILESGSITVNDVTQKYTVQDAVNFLVQQIDTLSTGEIKHRPIRFSAWQDPCRFCKLKDLCDKYDEQKTIDFKTEARAILQGDSK